MACLYPGSNESFCLETGRIGAVLKLLTLQAIFSQQLISLSCVRLHRAIQGSMDSGGDVRRSIGSKYPVVRDLLHGSSRAFECQ